MAKTPAFLEPSVLKGAFGWKMMSRTFDQYDIWLERKLLLENEEKLTWYSVRSLKVFE
jgi:hypothetical protein